MRLDRPIRISRRWGRRAGHGDASESSYLAAAFREEPVQRGDHLRIA
jgi:hypothetical protein